MTNKTKNTKILAFVFAMLVFALAFGAFGSFAFAASVRGVGKQSSAGSHRGVSLMNVQEILDGTVPEQAESPNAIGNALDREVGKPTVDEEEVDEEEDERDETDEDDPDSSEEGDDNSNSNSGGNGNNGLRGLERASSVASDNAVEIISFNMTRINSR